MKIALGILIGAALMAGVAQASSSTPNSGRFTEAGLTKLRAHTCAEDDYRAILARRPNPRVTVNDPFRVVCLSREGNGWRFAR